MNNNAHSQREVNGAHSLLSQAGDLLDEAHALSYALVMVLAHTPRAELSREEIDALCQLAYELQNKLTKTHEVFQEAARRDQATPHNPLAVGAQPGRAQTEGDVRIERAGLLSDLEQLRAELAQLRTENESLRAELEPSKMPKGKRGAKKRTEAAAPPATEPVTLSPVEAEAALDELTKDPKPEPSKGAEP